MKFAHIMNYIAATGEVRLPWFVVVPLAYAFSQSHRIGEIGIRIYECFKDKK